jgi:hypothetical protein
MTTRADWEARVRSELEGRDVDSLAAPLAEGLVAPVLPDAAAGDADRSRRLPARSSAPRNMTRVDFHDAAGFRAEIIDDVRGGADALWIRGATRENAKDVAVALGDADVAQALVAVDVPGDGAGAEDLVAAIASAAEPERILLFVDPFRGRIPGAEAAVISTHAWRAAAAHGVL